MLPPSVNPITIASTMPNVSKDNAFAWTDSRRKNQNVSTSTNANLLKIHVDPIQSASIRLEDSDVTVISDLSVLPQVVHAKVRLSSAQNFHTLLFTTLSFNHIDTNFTFLINFENSPHSHSHLTRTPNTTINITNPAPQM